MNPEPIDRLEFDTAQLVAEHPPHLHDPNKKIVYEIACPPGCVHAGRIGYSRWGAMPLPERADPAAAVARALVHAGVYDYTPAHERREAVEWHVNFADPLLFAAYGSALLAQDEWQTAEHPALGSLVEALNARGQPGMTVHEKSPTPVLVTGVERRCVIATDQNAAEGRVRGLYGGAFARAEADVVRRATRRIEPPTVSHLIAIAAPVGGFGRYTADQIGHVLATAFTGFRAAVLESERVSGEMSGRRGASPPVVVHSGFWGCGVFGGNRLLMTILQMLAAEMAGVERLVLHTVDEAGVRTIDEAREALSGELAQGGVAEVAALVNAMVSMGFEWGVGDGN